MNEQDKLNEQEKQKRAPIALFLFALTIVVPILIILIGSMTYLSQKERRLEDVEVTNTDLLHQVIGKQTESKIATPSATETATPSPTQGYYYNYSPTPKVLK